MKIGINQFSYHRYFGDITQWETDPEIRWTSLDFIRRVGSLGVDAVSLQTRYVDSCDLQAVTDACAALDLAWIIEWGHPDGLKMGTSPDAASDLKRWLRLVSGAGGKLMRIVAGYPTYRGREPVSTQIKRLLPLLRELSLDAAELNVVLALENHGDFTPLEIIELIKQVGAPNLRATFDTGNCVRLAADLIASTHSIACIAEMIHLKDLWLLAESDGNPSASWPSAPLGQGMLDVAGVLKALRKQGFDGYLLIEMAHMHPTWPDEDKAVADSVTWLKTQLKSLEANVTKGACAESKTESTDVAGRGNKTKRADT